MKDTVDQVIDDLVERKQLGIERYGIALNANSDKNLLQEAYEEAMDLAIYLRAEIERRDKIE